MIINLISSCKNKERKENSLFFLDWIAKQELRPCPFKLKKMIYDKDRNENNSAHRWMNSFKRKTFKIKRILPSWYIRAFMFLIYRYFWFLNKKYFPLSRKNNVITWNERKKKRMNTGVFYFFCPDMEVCVSCNQHDSWWKRRHISISFGHTGLLKYEEGICYWRVFHLACHIIHNTGQPLKSRLPSHRRKSVQFS